MAEHRGTSFYNSCVKVPVDPCSRQPNPSYERIGSKQSKEDNFYNKCKINFMENDQLIKESRISDPTQIMDNFLKFLDSIPDYDQVYHLSNEQFKQEVDHLKRKQKLLLKNLENSLINHENVNVSKFSVSKCNQKSKIKSKNDINDLILNGKKCYLEESRTPSPLLFLSSKFNGLTEDQDLSTNSKSYKGNGTICKEKICLNDENWLNVENSNDNIESDIDSIETRSLPANITKEWHPTVPKPFSFTIREEAIKEQKCKNLENNKKNSRRKRRVRPIPLTSKIPLYDKLLAEKEERSRIIREESALNLMSQVRPFRLECDRRAWRLLTRSSPEIRSKGINSNTNFKAKPVPKNLFSTEIYDRMLEDEHYRQLQKRLRAAQLMKSSSLPPSMARRERVKSTCIRLRNTNKNYNENMDKNVSQLTNNNLMPLERYKSMVPFLPIRGNNLAAILRCQVSREKLEREIRDKMEERRREQAIKIKQSLIGRNPVWRALRCSARHEHERDLSIRTLLRRDEAREQEERHRLQMEMMLDRVAQIPTLFERHSQSYQSLTQGKQNINSKKMLQQKKKKKQQILNTISSYMNYENISRPDSRSSAGSSRTSLSASQSLNSSNTSISQSSGMSITKSQTSLSKRKGDRSQLKVSINETAELIEDQNKSEKLCNNESLISNNDCNENSS
ncbi:hypothetical protein QLX08_003118 [Tetragonisca angustula]|uniref:Protein FAM161A n=1 Tax=Tetragonisca angustula TaxID=166442 RepID=A0AAW1A862_9HYME